MPIHFRCARCQSSFPVDSQLRTNPNQCPICKCTSLSAEVGPAPRTKKSARQTCVAPALARKPVHTDRPVEAARPRRHGIDWRIVGVAGAGAALVVGCAILAASARMPRREPVTTTVDEPIVVAQVEEPVKPLASTPEPAPQPEPAAEPAKPATPIAPVPPVEEPKAGVAKAAPAPAPAPEKKPLAFKHRFKRADEELRRELLLVPEMGVKDIAESSRTALAEAPKNRKIDASEMPDFRGLPMRMGIDCQIGEEEAKSMQALSRKLRTAIFNATPRDNIDNRADVDQLRGQLRGKEWQQPEAIATLTQMLMPEGRQLRLLLVEMLAQIPGARASVALAQRAVFDLSQEVREAAVAALRDRPGEHYRNILVRALRYPWVPAADHAAEAIVTLEDRETLSDLVRMLREPDPGAAFRNSDGEPMVREMVRINHLANCTLCHASSPNAHEFVRGRVPSPSEPLPPPVEYYSKGGGIFVRADVTYLQQDFSVPQPVTRPGPWPTHQRYDYMIRLRPLKTLNLGEQVARIGRSNQDKFGQREAVLFALRELTGKDVGRSPESWERVLREATAPRP